jgi:hypothetical protein
VFSQIGKRRQLGKYQCLFNSHYREKKGKAAQPTIAIVDSQSCKNTSTCIAEVGVDGGKRIKGRKRFYVVDTLGCLLKSFVVAANHYDGVIAAQRWQVLGRSNIRRADALGRNVCRRFNICSSYEH